MKMLSSEKYRFFGPCVRLSLDSLYSLLQLWPCVRLSLEVRSTLYSNFGLACSWRTQEITSLGILDRVRCFSLQVLPILKTYFYLPLFI